MKELNNIDKFGELVRFLRKKNRIGLREFCKKTNIDPSNLSKIERGLLSPPKDKDQLDFWAKILKISKKSETYKSFLDLAEISRGEIPKDIMTNKDLLPLLPAFFRTIRGEKPKKEQIDTLIDLLRKS